MSASLVGSEMCIRDSSSSLPRHPPLAGAGGGRGRDGRGFGRRGTLGVPRASDADGTPVLAAGLVSGGRCPCPRSGAGP
eukprot:3027436-Alexandrium_andersonii.AAC.1